MKKWMSLLLAAAMVLSLLVGCGNNQTTNNGSQSNNESGNSQTDEGGDQDTEWTPDGPITIVVGMAAGGGIDAMARTTRCTVGFSLRRQGRKIPWGSDIIDHTGTRGRDRRNAIAHGNSRILARRPLRALLAI